MRAPRRYSNSPRWDGVPHRQETDAERDARRLAGHLANLATIDEWARAGAVTPEQAQELREQERAS
jgi:hypothetical protein